MAINNGVHVIHLVKNEKYMCSLSESVWERDVPAHAHTNTQERQREMGKIKLIKDSVTASDAPKNIDCYFICLSCRSIFMPGARRTIFPRTYLSRMCANARDVDTILLHAQMLNKNENYSQWLLPAVHEAVAQKGENEILQQHKQSIRCKGCL